MVSRLPGRFRREEDAQAGVGDEALQSGERVVRAAVDGQVGQGMGVQRCGCLLFGRRLLHTGCRKIDPCMRFQAKMEFLGRKKQLRRRQQRALDVAGKQPVA